MASFVRQLRNADLMEGLMYGGCMGIKLGMQREFVLILGSKTGPQQQRHPFPHDLQFPFMLCLQFLGQLSLT